jgi:hypothetical protein
MHLPAFSSRRLIGTAALACTAALASVAALAVTASSAPAGAGAASTPRCATSGLVTWLNNEENGTAGSFYYTLVLTNLSGHTCTLVGYPGVSAVNLVGHRLGSAALHDASQKPRVVTLASGAGATAVLRIVDVGDFSAAGCRPVTAAGLRVHPPGQTTSKVVPFPFQACSRSGLHSLEVQAVMPAK